jgi:hypothetical protein
VPHSKTKLSLHSEELLKKLTDGELYMSEEILSSPLLTEKEFAGVVRLAPVTIRKRRSQGLLPHYRFGRAVRYSWEMVEDFKRKNKHRAKGN